MQNKELFLLKGGEHYHYLPALNDTQEQIDLLLELVKQETTGWPETDPEVEDVDSVSRATNAEALDGY